MASDTGCGGDVRMAHRKTTGKKAASEAGRTLRNPKASKAARSAAGSALSQTKGKKH